jgi:glycosyltransferase involved in cell wall biosynthesis
MINGRSGTYKPGGMVVPLANPQATANAMTKLLVDAEFYNLCSKNIKERVQRDYSKVDMNSKYSEIYDDLIKKVGV